jgi:hypothetical protein
LTAFLKINIFSKYNIENIKNFIEILKKDEQIPRGIIDLHGYFVNFDNKTVAEKISLELPEHNIIFIDKDNNVLQLKNNITENFKGKNDKNFYYYDQSHTVGTDIEQPLIGHVLILINKRSEIADSYF